MRPNGIFSVCLFVIRNQVKMKLITVMAMCGSPTSRYNIICLRIDRIFFCFGWNVKRQIWCVFFVQFTFMSVHLRLVWWDFHVGTKPLFLVSTNTPKPTKSVHWNTKKNWPNTILHISIGWIFGCTTAQTATVCFSFLKTNLAITNALEPCLA